MSPGTPGTWRPGRSAPLALGIFTLALAVRIAYFLIIRHGGLTEPDSFDYTQLATRLVEGNSYMVPGLGSAGFPVDLIRPPGYPVFLFLANIGGHISVERTALVQCFLGAAFAGGLTLVVSRAINLRAGALAGALMALDWATVINTPLLLSDVLFAMLYAGGFALLGGSLSRAPDRRSMAAAALAGGVALGVATLVKPLGLVGALPILVAVLVRPRRNWPLATCLVTFIVLVLPWAIRNDDRYGILAVSTISTVNLYAYNAQGVLPGSHVAEATGGLGTADRATLPLRRGHPSASALYSRMNSDAVRILLHHLPEAVTQEVEGVGHVMFGTGKETLLRSTRRTSLPSILTTWIPLLQAVAMWALAAIGLLLVWRRRLLERSAVILLAGAVVVVLAAAGGPAGYGRYRLPAVPVESVFAAVALVALWEQGAAFMARRAQARHAG